MFSLNKSWNVFTLLALKYFHHIKVPHCLDHTAPIGWYSRQPAPRSIHIIFVLNINMFAANKDNKTPLLLLLYKSCNVFCHTNHVMFYYKNHGVFLSYESSSVFIIKYLVTFTPKKLCTFQPVLQVALVHTSTPKGATL